MARLLKSAGVRRPTGRGSSILSEVRPPTGEPYAGDPPVRFGGRGSCGSPYPYPGGAGAPAHALRRKDPILNFFTAPLLGGGEGLRSLHRSAGVDLFLCSKTPLKSPLVQGGTVFSSNVAPPSGMKNSLAVITRIIRMPPQQADARLHPTEIPVESRGSTHSPDTSKP